MNVIDPRWPDKMRASATLVVAAGSLGLLWGLLQESLSVNGELPLLLREGGMAPMAMSALAFGCGWLGLHWEQRRFLVVGAAAAMIGFAALGIAALLGALAFVALAVAHREREEDLDYPSHSMLAGLFLAAATVATFASAILLTMGRLAPVWQSQALFCFVAAGIGVVGVMCAHTVRYQVVPMVAAALQIAALGFLLAGPVFGVLALVQLVQSARHHEFFKVQLLRAGLRQSYG